MQCQACRTRKEDHAQTRHIAGELLRILPSKGGSVGYILWMYPGMYLGMTNITRRGTWVPQSIPGHPRVFPGTPEYTRVPKSIPGYPRVCPSVPQAYTRVYPRVHTVPSTALGNTRILLLPFHSNRYNCRGIRLTPAARSVSAIARWLSRG